MDGGVFIIIRINNFSLRDYKQEQNESGHVIQSGILTYGARPFLNFKEDMDEPTADMEFSVADPKITQKIIKERTVELQKMYRNVLRIANFNLFKVFELIVSDVHDLNNSCIKAREEASAHGFSNACLAISSISYAGEDLFFNRFWYSFHSSRESVTEKKVRAFFNEKARSYPKKVFKFHKIEESYQYVKLLKIIDFDLRQNIIF